MPYSASYATYIALHPLYVPYPICTSHPWVFPTLFPAHTPTTWVFSPEISSLRPFCQQTILSAHHLWVFPPLFSAPRPPRGFSPREASRYAHFASKPYSPHIISGFFRLSSLPHAHHVGFLTGNFLSTPISSANHTLRTSSLGFSNSLPRPTPTAWVFSPRSFSLRPFRQHRLASYPFPRQKFPPSLAISQGTLYTTYKNHTISKHTMIWIYIVLSVSGNIHMFGT